MGTVNAMLAQGAMETRSTHVTESKRASSLQNDDALFDRRLCTEKKGGAQLSRAPP